MRPAHSAFLKAHRCPKTLSSALPSSTCRPWPCWIAMGFTARRDFIPLPVSTGYAPMSERKLQYPAWAGVSRLRHGCRISMLLKPARLPLLCTSRAGYQNLCQLITRFKMRETTKCEGAATLEDLEQYSSGLVCLTGGDEGPLAAALMHGGESEAVKVTEQLVRALRTAECLCRTSTPWRA